MKERNQGIYTRGFGVRAVPGVTVAMIVLSVMSLLAAIKIIINFDEITFNIAIFIANILSSGLLLLIVVAAIVYIVIRLKCRIRKSMWGW